MGRFFKPSELKSLSKILESGEEVIAVGRQHRLSKFIAPSITLATSKRLIIIKRDTLGIRSDMHFIPYEHIVSFRLVHGFVFSSIKLRLLGASKPNEHAVTSQEEDETEILGLRKSTASILANRLSLKLHETIERASPGETIIERHSPVVNIFVSNEKREGNEQNNKMLSLPPSEDEMNRKLSADITNLIREENEDKADDVSFSFIK